MLADKIPHAVLLGWWRVEGDVVEERGYTVAAFQSLARFSWKIERFTARTHSAALSEVHLQTVFLLYGLLAKLELLRVNKAKSFDLTSPPAACLLPPGKHRLAGCRRG